MSQRYFRTDSDAVYEQARASLDAIWKLPPGVTCITPADTAPRDTNGRIVLAVDASACDYSGVPELLGGMISAGAAVEITAEEYEAAVPRTP